MSSRKCIFGFGILSVLLWTYCAGEQNPLQMKPKKGAVYAFELSNFTQKLAADEEAEYENSVQFEFTILGKSKEGFNLDLRVIEMDLPGDEENEDYMLLVDYIQNTYLGKNNPYTLEKSGKLVFRDTHSLSVEKRIEKINSIQNDDEYLQAMFAITMEEINKNMFNEWLGYIPEKMPKGAKWYTSNPLQYADKLNSERKFIWKTLETTADSIVIEGTNRLTVAETKQDLGGGVTLVSQFNGIMEFSSRIVIDPKDGMLLKADNNIITNGQITRMPQGPGYEGSMDMDVEPLEGIASTKIRRIAGSSSNKK
jgi:hypothetical protein